MILEEKDYSQLISNNERKKNVLYSFYALIGVLVLNILIATYYYFELIKYDDGLIDNVEAIEAIYLVVNLLQIGIYISTIVFFVLWFKRAYANLDRIGVYIENKVNMAFWGFVIPIINLSKPLKIAKEMDYKYDSLVEELDPNHKQNLNSYSIILAWFILYWVTNVYSRFNTKTEFETITEMAKYQLYDIFGFILTLISAVVTIFLIQLIGKSEDKLESLASLELLNKENKEELV